MAAVQIGCSASDGYCVWVGHFSPSGAITASPVERRSGRAILIDDEGRLVLIRRSKPGREPYWTTAGGGVEDGDASIEAAMHRELFEELGARAVGGSQVFLATFRSATGLHNREALLAEVGLALALPQYPYTRS